MRKAVLTLGDALAEIVAAAHDSREAGAIAILLSETPRART